MHSKILPIFPLATLLLLTACSEEKSTVTTHEQAFELVKREVLTKHMDRLVAVGADASIFEDVDMDVGDDWPCNKPKRYSSAYKTGSSGGIHVKIFENVEGKCKDCWNLIHVGAHVFGDNKIYKLKITKRPSWQEYFKQDGTPRRLGDEGDQCGPVDSKPSYVRKSPRAP